MKLVEKYRIECSIMAITRGLSFVTRDTIHLILDEENYSIERDQAKSILDQSINNL